MTTEYQSKSTTCTKYETAMFNAILHIIPSE